MTQEAQIVDSAIPFAGAASLIPLRSRAGYTVRLTPGVPERCGWIPADRRALELDVQVQILRVDGDWLVTPRVLWRLQEGHGALVYEVPRLGTARTGSPVQRGYVLPARGMRQRLAVRELTVELLLAEPDDEDEGVVTVNCSFQPAHSAEAVLSPNTDMHLGITGGAPCVLPIGATEMRLCDPDDGQPFAAGPTIQFRNLFGTVIATPTALSFADWRPIPISAAFWNPTPEVGAPTEVVYR
jgi:hypothetical protein